jgi:hypothetical protein
MLLPRTHTPSSKIHVSDLMNYLITFHENSDREKKKVGSNIHYENVYACGCLFSLPGGSYIQQIVAKILCVIKPVMQYQL